MTEKTESRPVILNACLTGMVAGKKDNPHIPLSPEEIAADAEAVWREGASLIHVHARDRSGEPTWDSEPYRDIIAGIRERVPDLVICVSTSGRLWKDRRKRVKVLELEDESAPDMASLTLGSVMFPKHHVENPLEDILYLLDAMKERGVRPELEAFDLDMVKRAAEWSAEGKFHPPQYVNILLGNKTTADASEPTLKRMVSMLPSDTVWAGAGIGRHQFPVNCMSIAMGGHARVGLEDSLFIYDERGKTPATNADLVSRVAGVAQSSRRPISTPAETRETLGLPASSPAAK